MSLFVAGAALGEVPASLFAAGAASLHSIQHVCKGKER